MKKPHRELILFCFLTFSILLNVSAQQYKWVKGGSAVSYQNTAVRHMCTDSHNNIYITSNVSTNNIKADSFFMQSAFNTGTFTTQHALLASYKCNGQMRWAKLIDASENSYLSAIACSDNSIYYVDYFNAYATNKHIGYDTSFDCTYNASLLIRFDTSGKFKWSRFLQPDTTGVYGDFIPKCIDVDERLNIHVFVLAAANTHITSTISTGISGNYDLVYDSSGQLLKTYRLETDSAIYYARVNKAIINKKNKHIFAWLNYVVGLSDDRDYIAEFDSTGHVLWSDTAKNIDTLSSSNITDIGIDTIGNLYCSGRASHAFILGSDTVFSPYTVVTGAPPIDVIARLTNTGKIKWHYDLNAYIDAMTVLPNGEIAVTGDADPMTIHGTDTSKAYASDLTTVNALFCLVDSSGHTVLLDQLHGCCGINFGTAITGDGNNNVYIGGTVSDSVYSDGIRAYNSYVITHGGDFFVAKYGSCNCSPGADISSFFTKSRTDTVQFHYYGSPADSLHWYFGDGTMSKEINPVHAYKNKALYHVCVTAYGCNDSAMYCDTVTALGLINIDQPLKWMNMYPNPTKGVFTIDGFANNATVQVYNIFGITICQSQIINHQSQINISSQPNGIYFVHIISGENTVVKKIVKE